MSENKPLTKLSTLGEFGLIRHLTQDIKLKNESSLKGVGDDAAVLDYKDKKVLVSTDMLIEGVHFDLAYAPLETSRVQGCSDKRQRHIRHERDSPADHGFPCCFQSFLFGSGR